MLATRRPRGGVLCSKEMTRLQTPQETATTARCVTDFARHRSRTSWRACGGPGERRTSPPAMRRVLVARQRQVANKLASLVDTSGAFVPALPVGAAFCAVNYYEKSGTCLGFIHSGSRCSHLYAVEALVLQLREADVGSGRHLP
jgi:hypothetical protein